MKIPGKLDNREIRERISEYNYTSGYIPSEKIVDDILEQFWFHDFYNSFISDETILDYLLKYLDEKHPKTFNQYDYYKFFFDKIAPAKARRNQLQLLALKFEQFQLDRIQYTKFTSLLRSNNLSTLVFLLYLKRCRLGRIKNVDNEKLFIWNHQLCKYF